MKAFLYKNRYLLDTITAATDLRRIWMVFHEKTMWYAAVFFFSALIFMITGLLVYMLWFSGPGEPPRRSLPVLAAVLKLH